MNYRSDLNGLRAVAVILVLLFHLDLAWIKGGFLGVDVFLVLSGYFISKNIITELDAGKFSFLSFYKKRIRRIFPAMLFTVVITLVAGYILLMPVDLIELGKSAFYSVLSVVNIFFYKNNGYFDAASASRPMLQMWSLSLEEQFYFIWPLLLFLLCKFRKGYGWFIGLAFLASLMFAVYKNEQTPVASFFLLPFRVFEFAIGAACVLPEKRFTIKKGLSLVHLAGIACILFSAVVLNNNVPMPGMYSLLPCAGVMILIVTGDSIVKRIVFNNKVFEYIGKTSYSIYLIHWPLIVFYKYYILRELNWTEQIGLGLISLILGFLMWKFIENPFRKHGSIKRDPVWIWAPVSVVILCLASYSAVFSKGYPMRFPALAKLLALEDLDKEKARYWDNTGTKIGLAKCSDSCKKIIIMGNSHAVDLTYALVDNGMKARITFLATSYHCYNYGTPVNKSFTEECSQLRKKNLSQPEWKTAEAIYLHDNWSKADMPNLAEFLADIRKVSNAPVYIFGPKMTFSNSSMEILRDAKKSDPDDINSFAKKFRNSKDRIEITNQLKKLLNTDYYRERNFHFIDLLKVQCGNEYDDCKIVSSNTRLMYFDNNHLTEVGAIDLGAKLKLKYPDLF